MMVAIQSFEGRIKDALQVKLDPDVPTFDPRMAEENLADLLRTAGQGVDPLLLTLLNCTVGGSGYQPLEAELVADASRQEKQAAICELENQLSRLQQTDVVTALTDKLRALAA
jgi:hypothetical protein